MPFGLLWCCYQQGNTHARSANHAVTNAFRPFVVLLLVNVNKMLDCGSKSPMPFGLLWCCYVEHDYEGAILARQVTNAFRPFVVLLRAMASAIAMK